MAAELELIGPTDKPALLGISQAESLAACQAVLAELGYKVYMASSHDDFGSRFNRVAYQLVLIEDLFDARTPAENTSLLSLQSMPMNQRRHAAVLLLGDSFQTLSPMQAFQQSVHAVVNRTDLPSLSQIVQQVVADNNLLLSVYREVQVRSAPGNM